MKSMADFEPDFQVTVLSLDAEAKTATNCIETLLILRFEAMEGIVQHFTRRISNSSTYLKNFCKID